MQEQDDKQQSKIKKTLEISCGLMQEQDDKQLYVKTNNIISVVV